MANEVVRPGEKESLEKFLEGCPKESKTPLKQSIQMKNGVVVSIDLEHVFRQPEFSAQRGFTAKTVRDVISRLYSVECDTPIALDAIDNAHEWFLVGWKVTGGGYYLENQEPIREEMIVCEHTYRWSSGKAYVPRSQLAEFLNINPEWGVVKRLV